MQSTLKFKEEVLISPELHDQLLKDEVRISKHPPIKSTESGKNKKCPHSANKSNHGK